jgi:hypothetical protein
MFGDCGSFKFCHSVTGESLCLKLDQINFKETRPYAEILLQFTAYVDTKGAETVT